MNSMEARRVRLIAFYLPQYHPIPENDEWWGKGFTEWTNVAKAKPLFRGHYQPHVPADLGFYDLRVPETRAAQAELAAEHGIEGFCYWHYWFAGRRILERPFNEVLKSGEPEFPFCLAWANDPWTGIWHGLEDTILIDQTYPGADDYKAHFQAMSAAFWDKRYLKVDGKLLFVIYRPDHIPEPKRFSDLWQDLAAKAGLKGFYFVAVFARDYDPRPDGFDATIVGEPAIKDYGPVSWVDRFWEARTKKRNYWRTIGRKILGRPDVYLYEEAIKHAVLNWDGGYDFYPCLLPNWDNTPRSGKNGLVYHNSTPDLFRIHLRDGISRVRDKEPDKRIMFVKSWNEWAEGNYLEPERRFGRAYLEVIRDELKKLDLRPPG
jgi:hypothetical protein